MGINIIVKSNTLEEKKTLHLVTETKHTMPPPRWQVFPLRYVFLVAATLRKPVVLSCQSCPSTYKKKTMPPFLDVAE